jgi:hypothetical protein
MNDAVTPAASAAFVDPAARRRSFPLKYPVTYGDKVFAEVRIQRLTVAEVAAFFEGVKGGAAEGATLPFYRDAAGDPLPPAVFDALDDDDAFAIEQGLADFLPRRVLAMTKGAGAPPAGEPTASSSAA